MSVLILLLSLFHFINCEVNKNDDDDKDHKYLGRAVDIPPYNHSFVFTKEAVATDVQTCSEVGEGILKINGTAVDAAVASLICLGALNPMSSGIGGGGFMLVHSAEKSVTELIDFREASPGCIHTDSILNSDFLYQGGLSVGVPGELKGMEEAWKKYGHLSWKKLFEPTINILSKGIKIGKALALSLLGSENDVSKDPMLSDIFMSDHGLLKEGDVFYNHKLKKFLEMISKSGSKIFYEGKLTMDIVEEIVNNGGCVSEKDFSDYKVKFRKPIKFKLKDYTFLTGPAPTSGPVLSLMLRIFESCNVTDADMKENAPLVYHKIIESLKYGYGYRMKMADPDFEESVNNVTKQILSDELIQEIKSNIGYRTHPLKHYTSDAPVEIKTGTTHLTVIDKFGNCVSVTSTINAHFGAKFGSSKYGFVYNNEMDDFSFPNITNEFFLPPSKINYPKKGKRPQSSAAPVILLDKDGDVIFSAGGSGGTMITSSIAQVMINYVFLGMDLKDAMDSPRLHNQLTPDIVYAESRFPSTMLTELTRFGHKTQHNTILHGVLQAIAKVKDDVDNESDDKAKDGTEKENSVKKHATPKNVHVYAESDFRKGGLPAGL